MNINCGKCHRSNRFKGKRSQISRGVKLTCSHCGHLIQTWKKSNGKVAVK